MVFFSKFESNCLDPNNTKAILSAMNLFTGVSHHLVGSQCYDVISLNGAFFASLQECNAKLARHWNWKWNSYMHKILANKKELPIANRIKENCMFIVVSILETEWMSRSQLMRQNRFHFLGYTFNLVARFTNIAKYYDENYKSGNVCTFFGLVCLFFGQTL